MGETQKAKMFRAEAKSIGIKRVFVGTPRDGFKEFSRAVTEARKAQGGN